MRLSIVKDEELINTPEWQQFVADNMGMIDYSHFMEFKRNAVCGMIMFGDLFLMALGYALKEADDNHSMKIMRIWRNEITQCEMLYKMHVAKEKAGI